MRALGSQADIRISLYNSNGFWIRLKKDILTNPTLYIMIVPVIVYYILFHYVPMYGIIISFKNFTPSKGVLGSPWVGFSHFKSFFTDIYFSRIFYNTFKISIFSIVFGFPAPIILALMINEVKKKSFTRMVQTITYMPHFISLVVVCGIIKDFTSDAGIITHFLSLFGFPKVTMLSKPEMFVPIYVISGIWQTIGWSSIVYLAALSAINAELYEAAVIDGAGKWAQTVYVTLPSIMPTIVIMLVLAIGNMLNLGFEKTILLYNPGIYETSDVIQTYVYRKGLLEFDWSYSTAIGLFNSVINFALLITSNKASKHINGISLW